MGDNIAGVSRATQLYTVDQRIRRDNSKWTTVQGILAPLQFAVCLLSLFLVIRYLVSDNGYYLATLSIILKTCLLYLIMITGAIWEKEVFGQYLFAPSFFWEDLVSFIVIGLHTIYLVLLVGGLAGSKVEMWLALLAYFVYFINAGQFLYKLRLGREGTTAGKNLGRRVTT